MPSHRLLILTCLGWLGATAQTLPTMRVSSETAPPGGTVQVKLLMTSPKPIITGLAAFDLSGVSFDSIDGINLFSPTGDVAGAAVVKGSQSELRFLSPGGTFGAVTDYPLMTAAIRLSATCFPGQVMPINLNTSASLFQDLLGSVLFEYQQGHITVGGSISISNVVPGGGVLPAGSTFSILGTGFTPKTQITVRGMALSSVQYVSPTEFRATVKSVGRLDGTLIQAQNPDRSSDTYYSYMRGIQVGTSARALLAKTVPIFSTNPAVEAILPPTISPQLNPAYFTALALQNPGHASADITVQALSPAGAVTGSTRLTLAPGHRIQREISELFGVTLPTGSYLHIAATQPVQMLGLLGNDSTGVVLPVWVSVVNAPPVVLAGK